MIAERVTDIISIPVEVVKEIEIDGEIQEVPEIEYQDVETLLYTRLIAEREGTSIFRIRDNADMGREVAIYTDWISETESREDLPEYYEERDIDNE